MSLTNPLGDFEVTDPQAMRALAHPVRLAVLSRLQRQGPMTATALAEHVGASPSVTSWHLRHLASFGLVTDATAPTGAEDGRRRWWKAVARGIRFDMPDSPEGQDAGRLLRARMIAQALEHVARWTAEIEPDLEEPWVREAGAGNTGVRLTADEARDLQAAIEQLLAPYVTRQAEEPPAGADERRLVRVIRFFLPELPAVSDDPP
ncbi:ArsR/SmtB family transcription factor [Leekyejoonella antrihumi]|uniref:Helix-turn-helix transcriptional regulator n=1 Tax=Leekyejoonella antrihumi TaxID=1660198 RepID=A0A563DWI4_9MICO|nr:metalloregulator ArsR/SmtB family transcription factor [Leekyejoonella antrihumi]TWP34302.1 helix-turn-helix transcriptional regulator [Leekyejoonella antrihumi]